MPTSDPLDTYLTEQIVGPATTLVLGPSAGVRQVSDRALRLDRLHDHAGRGAARLRRLLRRHPVAALLLWSALLSAAVWLLARGGRP